ncbi:DASH complex subunit Dad2-domain-containing protein [Sphaerosporella brunnea]|uniref:DASH complex subunit DAD2 n=1 Tax=Sphaerosporella brunnea TaxID=1250544 RepID=A0A5J5EID1_9PEZI|nr:DASH complex subunit Dad2-domain-containing protein [Sphaerosporella brunnea]
MSAYPRYSIASQGRQSILRNPTALSTSQQAPALVARINEKKQELENLMVLRDLSADVARHMQELEDKLKTLADGTEAVAMVLSNWQSILRAIAMASTAIPKSKPSDDPFTEPREKPGPCAGFPRNDDGLPMPQTLVRIPIQNAKPQQQPPPQ